jgi:response regulator of citrate/malate metabolism
MTDLRVLIVEDDPPVAKLHSRFVAITPGFQVVGIVNTAPEALRTLQLMRPDLILLDLGLPDADGLVLLRRIRAAATPVDVIAVTAEASSEAVTAALRLGVVDYLVKPFYPDRLRQSLVGFRRSRREIGASPLDQQTIDRLRSDSTDSQRLPRDIDRARLERVREELDAAGRPLTATQVATAVGVSRVTARRYLEYLVTVRDVRVEPLVRGRGRPTKLYSLRTLAAPVAPRKRPSAVQRAGAYVATALAIAAVAAGCGSAAAGAGDLEAPQRAEIWATAYAIDNGVEAVERSARLARLPVAPARRAHAIRGLLDKWHDTHSAVFSVDPKAAEGRIEIVLEKLARISPRLVDDYGPGKIGDFDAAAIGRALRPDTNTQLLARSTRPALERDLATLASLFAGVPADASLLPAAGSEPATPDDLLIAVEDRLRLVYPGLADRALGLRIGLER